jgi:hypothetical protein
VTRVRALAAVLALVAVAAAVAGAPGVRAADAPALHQGIHEGAEFLIGMPPQWNGALVMFGHGYEGEGPGRGGMRSWPLSHLVARGYAGAASGYRSRGYRPDWFVADTLALRERFINQFGRPRWTIIHGQSMGGHVAVASLELHPDVYQGALVECGVIDGVGIVDWLYAYTAAAEYLSGVRLLDAPERQAFAALVNGPWLDAMGMPGSYTEQDPRAGDDDPRDRGPAGTVPAAAGLPAPHAGRRDVAPAGPAPGALGRALHVRRRRARAGVRRPRGVDGAGRGAGR